MNRWIGNNQSSGLTIDDRIWQKVRVEGECFIWMGSCNTNGYGQVRINGRLRRVHRYLWERAHGPPPAGYELDHLCRRRPCINLSHLEVVTHQENVRRGRAGHNMVRGIARSLEELATL